MRRFNALLFELEEIMKKSLIGRKYRSSSSRHFAADGCRLGHLDSVRRRNEVSLRAFLAFLLLRRFGRLPRGCAGAVTQGNEPRGIESFDELFIQHSGLGP